MQHISQTNIDFSKNIDVEKQRGNSSDEIISRKFLQTDRWNAFDFTNETIIVKMRRW